MLKRIGLVLSFAAAAACGGNDGDDNPDAGTTDSFDRRQLLADVANNSIVPALEAIQDTVPTLTQSVTDYCAAIDQAGEAEALASAQSAWRATMANVQRAEIFRVGPAAMNDNELRDRLYSWPLSSSCAVDQDVETRRLDEAGYDITGRLTNRRGMDALEYLLFSASLDHTCPNPVAPAGWNDLSDLVRKQARCGFAETVVADLANTATALVEGWSASGGNYLDDFTNAGLDGSSFSSAQDALNVLSDAMFYVEFEVKDIKLAEPTGIGPNSCSTIGEACLEERESVFADHSRENLVANLEAFREGFTGGDGVGFDDMLTALGAGELSTEMVADIDSMVATATAIPGSLRTALTENYQSVADTHSAVKAVTDNLKTQFLTVLGLDLPDAAAGDND